MSLLREKASLHCARLRQRIAELEAAKDGFEQREQELRNNENQYKFLVDNSKDIILILSKGAKIVFANQTAIDNYGYSRDELIGKSIVRLLTRDCIKTAMSALMQEFLGHPQPEIEVQARTKSGQIRYLSVAQGSAPVYRNGKLVGIMVSARDITEHKKAEQDIRRSEAHFRDLVEKAGIAIAIDDREGNLIYFNERYPEIFGYSAEEIKTLPIRSIVHPDDVEKVMGYHTGRLRGKMVPSRYEFKGIRKDGAAIYVEVDATVLKEGNKIIGTRSYLWDISGRKRAEANLRKERDKAQQYLDVAGVIIIILDLAGRITLINKRGCEILGYPEKEILGKNWFETCLPVPLRDEVQLIFRKLLGGEAGPVEYFENPVLTSSREQRIIAWHNILLKDEAGRVTGILTSGEDITARRGAELALRESEEKFRNLAEQSPNMIFIFRKGSIIYANRRSEEIMGYQRDEFYNPDFDFLRLIAPESRENVKKNLKNHAAGAEVPPYEYTLLTKRGQRIAAILTSKLIDYGNDKAILGIVTDITERKMMEEELKNSEEMFKIIFRYAPDAMYLSDLKGTFIDGNKMAEELTGYHKEELIGSNFLKLELLSPGQIAKAAALLARNALGKPTGPDEIVLKRRDGREVWTEIRTYPVRIKEKILVLGTARDVTLRKRAEKALLESERKLRLLAESMTDVVFVYDMNRRLQYVNPAVEKFSGYSVEELYAQNFINYLHPEDRPRMMALWDRLFRGESFSGEEFRIITKDGKSKWSRSTWGPLLDETGKQIGAQGREADITEHKLAEEALQKSEKKYRALFECANDAVFLLDSEGNNVMVNKKAADMLGYSIEELCRLAYRDVIAPSEYRDAKSKIRAMLEDETFALHERLFRKKDGTEFPVEINLSTVRSEEGKPLYIQRIARDITERKRAENELRQISDKLREALSSIIKVVVATVEQRDPYTAGHQNRVADLARAVAVEMGLPADYVEGVYMAGVIHDIGKISVPVEILSKPSRLSDLEFSLIKNHAQIGYDILREIEFPWPIAQIVYQHHERINGSGYPRGLSGQDILLEARILGVADVVEAMASHRPYRPAHGLKKALDEVASNRGILYDPKVANACLNLFSGRKFRFNNKDSEKPRRATGIDSK